MLSEKDLKPYQVIASNYIYNKSTEVGCLCFLDVGLGKTISTITALKKMRDNFFFNKGLIVSTKRVVDFVWQYEFMSWEQGKDFRIATREDIVKAKKLKLSDESEEAKNFIKETKKELKYTELKYLPKNVRLKYNKSQKILKAAQCKYIKELNADIYLINVENYAWFCEVMEKDWIFDTQVFDESSLFRNHSSNRFKAAKKSSLKTNTNICLTATPTPNGYINLWAQIFLVDKGVRLGRTITEFRDAYCFQVGFSYIMKQASKDTIKESIKDISISMDNLQLNESNLSAVHENYELVFEDKLKDDYKELEKDYYLKIKNEEIIAVNAAIKMNKLKQYCNGFVYSEDKTVIPIHDLKLKALSELVDVHNDRPLIVVYEFQSERDAILKKYPKAVTIDKFNQDDWDAGKIPMLVVHPKSAGHGLNLQRATNIMIWYSTTIDLELYEQMNGRINVSRQVQSGFNRSPIYYHIFFQKTIEQKIIKARNKKDITQKELLEYLMF